MTIVSLLATTVGFGWRIASSAWQKASIHLERSRTVLETERLLQEQMASMVPYRVPLPAGGSELFFEGEPQAARFLSRYSLAGRASSGLYRIEYQIADGTNGAKELLMNEFPVTSREELGGLFAGTDDSSGVAIRRFVPFERGPQTVVLLAGLTECHFEYYSPPLPTEPRSWSSQWTSSNGDLPRGMAIRVETPADTGNVQMVSVVASVRNYSLRRQ
jgi:hypothetical protein